MTHPLRRAGAPLALASIATLTLVGCTDEADFSSASTALGASGSSGVITVTASDTACELSATSAQAGTVTFDISNAGSKVNEFYVYAAGDRIVSEVENITPGLKRQLKVEITDPGTFTTACKPGMVGDGIRAPLTVTGDEASGEAEEAVYDREIEIEVASSGEVSTVAASSLAGTVGEKIEFKLENESDTEHYLVLSGPDGAKVDEAEAGPDSVAEFIAELSVEGDHTISVYPEDAEDKTVDQTLSVTAS